MNLYGAVNSVLKRLDDYPAVAGEREWSRAELELYVKDGYDVFCRRTKAIFDMFYVEVFASAGNYVGKWEENYFDSGMIAVGLVNFTATGFDENNTIYWEQDFAEVGAIGPRQITQPWEADYLDAESTSWLPVGTVPEDNVAVDRGTFDYIDLDPEYSQWFEEHERNFQTVRGTPLRFAMDRDGIGGIRLVPGPNFGPDALEISGTFGLLRTCGDDDGLSTWDPTGSWGSLREIPQHFRMGGQFGIPRRLFSDVDNARIEYFRLGKDPGQYQFDLPDRFVKYVEHYAQAKALERDGPGQDLSLAQHFMQRFEDGVSRMIRRLGENRRARRNAIGSGGKPQARPALARLPYQYGRQIRRA